MLSKSIIAIFALAASVAALPLVPTLPIVGAEKSASNAVERVVSGKDMVSDGSKKTFPVIPIAPGAGVPSQVSQATGFATGQDPDGNGVASGDGGDGNEGLVTNPHVGQGAGIANSAGAGSAFLNGNNIEPNVLNCCGDVGSDGNALNDDDDGNTDNSVDEDESENSGVVAGNPFTAGGRP